MEMKVGLGVGNKKSYLDLGHGEYGGKVREVRRAALLAGGRHAALTLEGLALVHPPARKCAESFTPRARREVEKERAKEDMSEGETRRIRECEFAKFK